MALRHHDYYMQDGDVIFLVSLEASSLPANVHVLASQRSKTRFSKFTNVSLFGVRTAPLRRCSNCQDRRKQKGKQMRPLLYQMEIV